MSTNEEITPNWSSNALHFMTRFIIRVAAMAFQREPSRPLRPRESGSSRNRNLR